MPLLTVITTVYNADRFISDSLTSLTQQSFKDFEVILVDDGCTDRSMSIAKEFADRLNIITLTNNQNYGVPISRNRALRAASGDLIAIHDADDISLPNRLEKEVDALTNRKEVTFLGSHAIKISENNDMIGLMSYPPPTTTDGFRHIIRYKLNPIIDPSCIFRKKSVIDIGGYNEDPDYRYVQDFELWCRLLSSGHQMSNIQEPLIKYRINSNGVSKQHHTKMREATNLVWSKFRMQNMQRIQLAAKDLDDTSKDFFELFHSTKHGS